MLIRKYKNEEFFQNKYCHGKIIIYEDSIEISMMNVEPQYRNQGYAKKLMGYLLSHIRDSYSHIQKIVLSPLPLDTDGLQLNDLIGFYKRFGFQDVKEHPQDKPYMMELYLK